jgi:xanthine dehydrogenase molybdopterin-binding subunit B
MKMYRHQLLLGQAQSPDYVGVNLQEGDRLEVDGKVMVNLHGHYVPAKDGWTPIKADALLAAAAQIESICGHMMAVAARQREAANKAVIEANRRIRMPVPEGGMSRTFD